MTGVGVNHFGQPFAEYLLHTQLIAATKLTCMKLNADADSMPRQIGNGALIVSMQTTGRMVAFGTVSLRLHRLRYYRDGLWLGDEMMDVDGGWIGN